MLVQWLRLVCRGRFLLVIEGRDILRRRHILWEDIFHGEDILYVGNLCYRGDLCYEEAIFDRRVIIYGKGMFYDEIIFNGGDIF